MRIFDPFYKRLCFLPDPAGGGAAPVAEPTSDPSVPANGPVVTPQGQPAADEGFWGRFPTVPQEQRALLEPHLKNVQGYVTQMQQRYAPFKDYTDDQVQGLGRFATDFESNPLGMWLGIAQQLQESGVIHADLDLEALTKFSQGQFEDEEPNPAAAPVPNGVAPTGQEEIPQWAQEMRAWQKTQDEEKKANTQREQERRENQLFNTQFEGMKTELKAAGLGDEILTDEELTARIIAHKGDVKAATTAILNMRTALLKGFVAKNNDDSELDLANGVPKTRTKPNGRRTPRDSFEAASVGAEQFLKQTIRGAAQE